MDEDPSTPSTPGIDDGSPEDSEAKDLAILQTYLDQVPYQCESPEQMDAKLQEIVGKLIVCAKTKNWPILTTWDGVLQCWLLLRYPIAKPVRANLVAFYFHLSLLPGIEPKLVRGWVDMITRLLPQKPGNKRKLEITDLELPWKPLWRALQRELWPRTRLQDSSRNMINILMYLAEHCKAHFSPADVPEMLDTMLPLLTKESMLTMVPVMTSFMPLSHTHLYLPFFMRLWEGFNSSVADDRFLDLLGALSERHVAGHLGPDGQEGNARWKEVGIFTTDEWNFLVSKALGSMHVPVGAAKGVGASAVLADLVDPQSMRIKKSINRYHALARIFVYSMSQDSVVRTDSSGVEGCLAGSKALDSLDKLVTGTETFFHPSNSGPWSIALTSFVQHLTSEFGKRWHAEQQSECKTPPNQRMTLAIRLQFVTILRTPCLLAMFSKDPISAAYAQSGLRSMALLEPHFVMPELLERAYDGLEAVIETHRTTAVLGMLTGMVRPLVCENVWLGGQKHVVPLLMGTLAGIDLNDPVKTICATRFIIGVAQHIRIGDLSGKPVVMDDATMEVDNNYPSLPDGTESGFGVVLSRQEERELARDTTANFADWVTSLFRRVFALYENLPEEGGRRNTTGGKQEETVLQSIKAMLDVVCIHLSEPLFGLVLNLVFDYAATNAKANAVKAFGQLIGSLARSRPEKTLNKFLPLCTAQIEDELKHGASSMRTTSSTHAAVPSDTTLHWNLAILRGCWGYGGSTLIHKKQEIFRILTLLVEKTKSERGYSNTCRLITRIAHTVSGTYPLHSQFVNTEQWEAESFDNDHMRFWGQQYQAEDVVLEWHVPNDGEIEFILDLMDTVISPTLDTVEKILDLPTWDEVARNDFCRNLHVSRAFWAGLSMFLADQRTTTANPCLHSDTESTGLIVSNIGVRAGFVLNDVNDPRYQRASAFRNRFGQVLKRASSVLSASAGEDHIDPIMGVLKSIDVYMLEYGMSRGGFDQLQKAFRLTRDMSRCWVNDKSNARLVFTKRAQVYHSGRVYVQTLYRRRSELDDTLLRELKEASLSHYTRVRRYAQAVLHNICSYYVRSARFILPDVFEVVRNETVPDRKKGALYILANKGISAYALSDTTYPEFLMALLQCQNEEKPSIQKLVNDLSSECLSHLQEETVNTSAYTGQIDSLEPTLSNLAEQFAIFDEALLAEAQAKNASRIDKRQKLNQQAVESVLSIANNPGTHWRYVLIALRFLNHLCRRDAVPSPALLKFFISQTLSPQPSIRKVAQRAVIKSLAFVKLRTYTSSLAELWLEEVKNPLMRKIPSRESRIFQDFTEDLDQHNGLFIDKIPTGFLTWSDSVKAYLPAADMPSISTWESAAAPALESVHEFLVSKEYFKQLSALWGQESSVDVPVLDVRTHNLDLIKSLIMTYDDLVPSALAAVDDLLLDADKFKQRAGAEVLAGILRGIKHYPQASSSTIWAWTIDRLDRAFPQVKPDTVSIWESLLSLQLSHRDPRRNQRLVNWILSRPLELHGDSAFEMVKNLSILGILMESLGMRVKPLMNKHILPLFHSINTPYAEVRSHISHIIGFSVRDAWRPSYASVQELLRACGDGSNNDPLLMNSPAFLPQMAEMQEQLTRSREERLPPPRVSQSEYDKCGLSILTWIWLLAHSPQAGLVFPYAVSLIPEVLRMTNIQDNPELQVMSSAVLYLLASVAAPKQYVGVILDHFIEAITKSDSWRIRRHALPVVLVFYFRNLLSIPPQTMSKLMDVLIDCLKDENIEVREMAAKVLAGVVRCSQRHRIPSLKTAFLRSANRVRLPSRRDPGYADSLRLLHSSMLGLCSLIESFPYSPVEPWMPALIEVLANHSTDPAPVSTTIRKCASEFKKTHQDTWAKDAASFSASQISDLHTILAGTSYYA